MQILKQEYSFKLCINENPRWLQKLISESEQKNY